MENVRTIIFRRLTNTDFFSINKAPGTEIDGGGQSYIDIPISSVSSRQWDDFFQEILTENTQSGPKWNFEINSLGVTASQYLTIGQRRAATYSIRAQKLHSRASNRVYAWHTDYTGFPTLRNPREREEIDDLVIYITKLENATYWAGWFHQSDPSPHWSVNYELNTMFRDGAGIIEDIEDILFDETDAEWPFRINNPSTIESKTDEETTTTPTNTNTYNYPRHRTEEEILEQLFDDDESSEADANDDQREQIRIIRNRNSRAVRLLKELYEGECQISGRDYTFRKRNGILYSEGHHLIPVGEGGSDSELNLIIVSPLIHKMLHYAEVSPIDINEIENNQLEITINNEPYTITWHPEHARAIIESVNE